jgi:uncharacterized membrane protein/uncharacterized protein YegL
MNDLSITFARPIYLVLLGLIPILWYASTSSMLALQTYRRYLALALRTLILILLVAALAEIQWVRAHQAISVLFLLDQSDSLSQGQRDGMIDLVKRLQKDHQKTGRGDQTGVIVFGKEAALESPLQTEPVTASGREVVINRAGSNLAEAMRLAQAAFPQQTSKRIVLISDGNETEGQAFVEADRLRREGVAIDVVAVERARQDDVLIRSIDTPTSIRKESPFDVSIVLDRSVDSEADPNATTAGRLIVTRRIGSATDVVADQAVEVKPGHNLFRIRENLEEPGFFTYRATFVPDDGVPDLYAQNNAASGFTQVTSEGRVLMLISEGKEKEYENFVEILRRHGMHVDVRTDFQPFADLSELQSFDLMILADIPRVQSNVGITAERFSDRQMEMIVQNIEQFGAGLMMLGGPDSFGVGGWTNTPIETAMPVTFQVKNKKVAAVGAIALVIDKSGSMSGDKINLAKLAAKAASMLGDLDYVGVYAFDADVDVVVPLRQRGSAGDYIKRRIMNLKPGGGTNMSPALNKAYDDLQNSAASVKHLIVLTDGLTHGDNYPQLAEEMKSQGITTTSVSIGQNAASTLLQEIALRGGGNYYQPQSPRALPNIFMKETRVVLRPLIFEDEAGIAIGSEPTHEVMSGISPSLPSIGGFVLSTRKESPLVETLIKAERPESPNDTIMAVWPYGIGRTLAWTTDAGQRWAKGWNNWPDYEKLVLQSVRWSMRSVVGAENFRIATEIDDNQLRVTVHAIDQEGTYRNGLNLVGGLTSGDLESRQSLAFKQVGPGRYVAETTLDDPGEYLVTVLPSGERSSIVRTGVTFQNSEEYRPHGHGRRLLQEIAESNAKPSGITDLFTQNTETNGWMALPSDPVQWPSLKTWDVYRPVLNRSVSSQEAWPWCLFLAASLFFFDVANRRIAWVELLSEWLPSKKPVQAKTPAKKAATRSSAVEPVPPSLLPDPIAATVLAKNELEIAEFGQPTSRPTTSVVAESEETDGSADSYASRLLKAKREAQKSYKQ